MIQAIRYHDISCGHRVVGHENKCRYLHGHNYRVHFYCVSQELDKVGRVIDFSIIKSILCQFLESVYDHKMLIWEDDPMLKELQRLSNESITIVPFNPTAENIAKHLVENVAPELLKDTGVILRKVIIEETRKCSASYELKG